MFKRVNSDVVPFSINSPAGNRYAFGTTDVSNDIDVNYNENIKKGFGTGPNEFPELEDFNALMFTGSYLAAYLYQAGIPEWNDKQKYYINSIIMGSDGNLYKSLTGTEETPNTNNNPILAGSTSWKSILSDYALKNGSNQNLFKVKDAVADDEAINKKQLDEAIDGLNQEITITGSATFDGATQNINLTNIGNITLAIGDVIEVTGTTSNNKLFTVESIVDNNNIVVNYEHRGTITPVTEGRLINETASNCTIKLYNRAKNAPLGQGQYWCVPATVRVLNQTYTNSTKREIEIRYLVSATDVHISVVDGVEFYVQKNTSGVFTEAVSLTYKKSLCFIGHEIRYQLEKR
ncbi:hypothetical protein NG774_03865 [Aliarcobacter cryaerophilus]|uniref:hypothetical protein n=1 Tax=Aliarcobacter cryaerophilus TaxID=28198 RepID=UPI003DA3EA46